MKKYLIIGFLVLIGCQKEENPMETHFNNWKEVGTELQKNKSAFSKCRNNEKNIKDEYVAYTFNVIDRSIASVKVFNDPYPVQDKFHECIKGELAKIKFSLKKEKEFKNGYLLINGKEERFNYVLY